MSRESILIILGVLVLIAPWSGLPLAWLEWILPILGLAIVFTGVTLRMRAKDTSSRPLQELY